MKTLKTILIIIAVILAIPLLIALFVSRDYSIAREVVINKPNAEVFDYVKHLKNQEEYSVWVRMDPNMKREYKGTDGTTGFIYAWDSEEAGTGEQEIKELIENESIRIELRFKRPFEAVATAPFHFETVNENQTKVTWEMNGRSPYPFNFMNLFSSYTLGAPIQQSLDMLKSNLEKQ